ncbi:MAG: hypothetical protein PVJ57_09280 [Phycisphaerae bacterium]|jgi:hypothetical protein
MSATLILAELQERHIELRVHGDRLRYRPRCAMTPDLAEQVKAHKAELLRLLRQTDTPHELSLAERVETGYVNPGWQPAAWAERLRQLADACEKMHPDTATRYRAWAANVTRGTAHRTR